MKTRTYERVVVRRNPEYNPNLTKDWLVINVGTCVGEFDSKKEAETHRDKVSGNLPKISEVKLNRKQELKNELRNTPKKEIKKRRQIKAELELLKTQDGRTKAKTREKKSALSEAYDVLLPKKTRGKK